MLLRPTRFFAESRTNFMVKAALNIGSSQHGNIRLADVGHKNVTAAGSLSFGALKIKLISQKKKLNKTAYRHFEDL